MYCIYCGTELSGEAKYCSSCGEPIIKISQQSPPVKSGEKAVKEETKPPAPPYLDKGDLSKLKGKTIPAQMAKAGYCKECKKNVWLKEDGSCQFGHPKLSIISVYDTQVKKAVFPQRISELPRANLGKRWVALIIDFWLIYFLFAFTGIALQESLGFPNWVLGFFAIGGILAIATNQIFGLIFYGTTIGKRIFGLKVVIYKTGEKPSFWRALLRFIIWLPSVIIGLPFVLAVLLEKEKRGTHDWLAGTYVTEVKKDKGV